MSVSLSTTAPDFATRNMRFQPPRGQVALDFPASRMYGSQRSALVSLAKQYVSASVVIGGQLKVFTPKKGLKVDGTSVSAITGAVYVALDVIFDLYVLAPETASVNGAMDWAVETFPDVIPLDEVYLGKGKTGVVTNSHFKIAEEYFFESMNWALAQNRAAQAKQASIARSTARNAAAKAKFMANRDRRQAERRARADSSTPTHLTQKAGANV